MVKKAIDYLELEHLSGTQRDIAEVIGIEAYRKLCTAFGGDRIRISEPDVLISKSKEAILKKLATPTNQNELHRIFGISQSKLDKILKGIK